MLMWHPPFPSHPLYFSNLFQPRLLLPYFRFLHSTYTFLHHRRRQPPPLMTTDPGIILFGKKIGITEAPKITDSLPFYGGLTADDNPKTPSIDEDDLPEKNQSAGALKKPDKILPCPRCESMNTKFCYYNNSNVNQPRHFCKSCQRYWTAGGTMRSMPVGAGRRKKKSTSSDCRFIIAHEAFESGPQIEFTADSDGVHNASRPPKVLSFTPSTPSFKVKEKENGDDCSSGSTVLTSNSGIEKPQENNGFHSQVHWIPGTPWSYNPWVPMPIPTIGPPGYPPVQFYPSPYWNSVSWLPPATSAPNYSTLGKHSSDRESIKPNEEPKRQKNSVLIPKTLRIDDPDEAAKSSIWATLGIKNENSSRRDLFKAFESKGDEKKKHPVTEPSLLLQANPAAFSRSLYFQERA